MRHGARRWRATVIAGSSSGFTAIRSGPAFSHGYSTERMADPSDNAPQARLAAAQKLVAEQRPVEAMARLEALLRDHPTFLQAKYELGVACFHAGALAQAIGWLTEVCIAHRDGFASDEPSPAL